MLHADLDVEEFLVLEDVRLVQRTLDEASAVGFPYFASRSRSSDPALTRSDRHAAILRLSRDQPHFVLVLDVAGVDAKALDAGFNAAIAYFHWKWMSATTGTVDFAAIATRASASSQCGTATRTMSTLPRGGDLL